MKKRITTKYYRQLENYIAGEFLFSFFVCFLFYFFIFLLNHLLLLAKQILAKGIPLPSVLLLIFYSLPTFITLAVPFATLTATLMAYGQFSSENEILAMRSLGFNFFVIFRPVLVLGITLAFLSFITNDFLLPAGNRAFQKLWLELTLTNPGLELEEHAVRKFKNSTLVTGDIDETGIHPLIIIENDNSGNRSTLMTKLAAPDIQGKLGKIPGFNMFEVFTLIPDSKDRGKWSWSRAESMEYRPFSDASTIVSQQTGPASMRASAVRKVVKEKRQTFQQRQTDHKMKKDISLWSISLNYAALSMSEVDNREEIKTSVMEHSAEYASLLADEPGDHSLQVWTLEFYQKYAIPFACIPFVVLAFPLGLTARRGGRAVGFFVGLLLATFYWSLLVLGRSLGLRSEISPFVVMALPDILLLLAGIALYPKRNRV